MESETPILDFVSFPSTQYRDFLLGVEIARTIVIALFALMIYEYAITLDDEKKYFWRGPYSVSHILFFFNRYVPPCIVIVVLVCFLIVNPTVELTFFLTLLAINVDQVILITHIWFLFPGASFVRIGLILSFVISVATSLVFLGLSVSRLEVFAIAASGPRIMFVGCRALHPPGFWRIYLPSLVLHTGIQTLVTVQAFTNPDWKRLSLSKRLVKDGGVYYLIVILSVGFTSIGSFLTNVPQINIPATFSPLILSVTSIATTRLMFSLRARTLTVGSSFELLPMPGPSLSFSASARTPSLKSYWVE